MIKTLESKTIGLLRDFPELIPVTRDKGRDYYKIIMVTKGPCMLTVSTNTCYIDEPMIVFIRPADIVYCKKLSDDHDGYACLFRKDLLDRHTVLKTTIEKYLLFDGKDRNIIRLSPADITMLNGIFENIQQEEMSGDRLNEDAIQTYLQLLIIQSARISDFRTPDHVSDEYKHVHEFFNLLERETANVNYTNPIAMKTAKEFAASLNVHPNYLNTLLKKHTGQNVSTHIRNRLLQEARMLLLQTDWTLQDIGYSIGFAEQPNFSFFFKKNMGITPAEFRRRAGRSGIYREAVS